MQNTSENRTFTLSAIAAMAKNRVIGKNNQLPWHLPADLKHFKTITTGHAILMGRKTYESIGKPLPNRTNIILTRDPQFKADGCQIANNLEQSLTIAKQQNLSEIIIIGGAEIYREFLPRTNKLYLTVIDGEFDGDAYFPNLNTQEWNEIACENHEKDEANPYAYQFLILERK